MVDVLSDCPVPKLNITNETLEGVVSIAIRNEGSVMGVPIPVPSLVFNVDPLKNEVDAFVDSMDTYAKCNLTNITNFDTTPMIEKGIQSLRGMDVPPIVDKAIDLGEKLLDNQDAILEGVQEAMKIGEDLLDMQDSFLARVQAPIIRIRDICSNVSQWGAIVVAMIVGIVAFIALSIISGRNFWLWGAPLIFATGASWKLFVRDVIKQKWTDIYCRFMDTVDTDTCGVRSPIEWKGSLGFIVILIVVYEIVLRLSVFKKTPL
jgi:hypothetical protein|tara:strand:+ start:2936 stop:3721 length:786 start_codon:yes stop_codon:yes gene_type:complete